MATDPRTDPARADARAFLGVFLRDEALATARTELDEDVGYWGDRDGVEVLRAARSVLHTHAKVTLEAELSVLLLDLSLDLETIGSVLDLEPDEVHRIAVDEGLDELVDLGPVPQPAPRRSSPVPGPAPDEPSTREGRAERPPPTLDGLAPPLEDAPPTRVARDTRLQAPGHRTTTWRRWAVPLGLSAVALVLIVVLGGDRGGPVEVTDARMTEIVDRASGAPGEPRTRFTTGEDVRLWFSYETGGVEETVSITWWRTEGDDEVDLYTATPITLLPVDGGALNVAMSSLYSTEPGEYRVEVNHGDRVLVDLEFRIDAE